MGEEKRVQGREGLGRVQGWGLDGGQMKFALGNWGQAL